MDVGTSMLLWNIFNVLLMAGAIYLIVRFVRKQNRKSRQ